MAKSLKISKLAVATQTNLLMKIQPLDQLTKTIKDALNGTAKLRKSFQTFFITTSILFLSPHCGQPQTKCDNNMRPSASASPQPSA